MIFFLKIRGANTIRLPFHHKLFTDEDYMGLTAAQDGFQGYISSRGSVNFPMYMGEIGHNTDEWQEAFCKVTVSFEAIV